RFGFADFLEHQQKLTELLVIVSGPWSNEGVFESLWLGSHVGIKSCIFDVIPARPEGNTADLVGIRFSRHAVGPGSFWGPAAGKTADRKIKASPKEMHRATFPDESR